MPRRTDQEKLRALKAAVGVAPAKRKIKDRTQLLNDFKKLKKSYAASENNALKSTASSAPTTKPQDVPASDSSKKPSSTSKTSSHPADNLQLASNLPDNFFDNKEQGHKVKGLAKDLEQQREEEWKKYQAELMNDEIQLEQKKEKEETEEQTRRDLDDTRYQIHLYNKTDKLQDEYEKKQKLLRELKDLEFKVGVTVFWTKFVSILGLKEGTKFGFKPGLL